MNQDAPCINTTILNKLTNEMGIHRAPIKFLTFVFLAPSQSPVINTLKDIYEHTEYTKQDAFSGPGSGRRRQDEPQAVTTGCAATQPVHL